MTLCRRCGVEVEEGTPRCPLCREPLLADRAGEQALAAPAGPGAPEPSGRVQRWVLEILSLFALTSALVVLAADFATGLAVTWSRYPVIGVAFLWVSSVLLICCSRRVWIFLPAEIAAVALFLFALDRFTPGTPWFVPLAGPLTLLTGTILALVLVVARRRRLSPSATTATVLLAAGVFMVGLDLFLNRSMAHRWTVGWSMVVCACLLPVIALVLLLRVWFGRRRAELRKLLHL